MEHKKTIAVCRKSIQPVRPIKEIGDPKKGIALVLKGGSTWIIRQ
jgi:hypothetical protein